METKAENNVENARKDRGGGTATREKEGAKAGALGKARAFFVYGFAVVGFVLAALLVAGVVADGLDFDNTTGGYEPPYTGWTGEPIDWDEAYVTQEGFFKNGYVVDLNVDCTTGMIGFEVFNQRFDYREFSERALVVHEPRQACEAAGFAPRF